MARARFPDRDTSPSLVPRSSAPLPADSRGNAASRRVIQCRMPDAELVRRAAGGEAAAFEVVMRRYNRMLFRTARAILRDDAEAEDALQEAYLQAYRSLAGFRGEARLSTWLARIVANEALMRLRKQARRAEIVPMQSADATAGLDQLSDTQMDKRPERCAERG